jgi:hypothetical protein
MLNDIKCTIKIVNEESVLYSDSERRSSKGHPVLDDLTWNTIERIRYWVQHYEASCRREDLRILGWHLFNLLFTDTKVKGSPSTVRGEFTTTFSVFKERCAHEKDLRLRLLLLFAREAPKLSSLPWEYLYMPNEGKFLAQHTELLLSRLAPPELIAELEIKEEALRILIVVSSPTQFGPKIDAEDVITKIKSLDDSSRSIWVKDLRDPTYERLRSEVRSFRPHILHFIGHGKERSIYLLRPTEEVQYDIRTNEPLDAQEVDVESIRALWEDARSPRLVFLHACKGAAADSYSGFNSTARELVKGVPAVVAMQHEIANSDAALFAQTFYDLIGQGAPLDEAVTNSRYALGQQVPSWAHPRFGTPVVYVQNERQAERIIIKDWGRNKQAAAQLDSKPETPSRCPYGEGCPGLLWATDKCCMKCFKPVDRCPERHPMPPRGPCPTCRYGISTPAAPQPQSRETSGFA